ncbi:MAG: hypothetical protein K8I29_19680 [Alphaproteobacteria bacterium]|uniref:Uncharacterized protein n=1 Tax=Candidatus Nitrobium versatile TaxID=2884831 RepID=A0A953SDY2_9BACT|nr:hypothetical protein [Candidatus Nitrobium versatile]
MHKKALLFFAILLYGLVAGAAGFLLRMDMEFDAGYHVAYAEMNALLKEGASAGATFRVKGLDVSFLPLRDTTRKVLYVPTEVRYE